MDSSFVALDREVVEMKCDELTPIDLECNMVEKNVYIVMKILPINLNLTMR